MFRPTWCDIDPTAIEHNVRLLVELAKPRGVCAVVKADGYGHGASIAANAALKGGATQLAVALAEEGITLRDAGIEAPILLLSEAPESATTTMVQHDLIPTVYSGRSIDVLAAEANAQDRVVNVDLCIDTGMRRVGANPADVDDLLARVSEHSLLNVRAVWTHLALADDPGNAVTAQQKTTFSDVNQGLEFATHVANSAEVLSGDGSGGSFVRCGIAIYGLDPSPQFRVPSGFRPALALRSEVSFLKAVSCGEGVSYGHRWSAPEDTMIATVPIGYADGIRRDYGLRGGEVLIGGKRCPIVGVVTMDQLMVDVGPGANIKIGDEVVLVGTQMAEEITVHELSDRLDTIDYEIVCAISKRVPRRISTP